MLKLVNPRQRLSPSALVHGNGHQTQNSEDTGEPPLCWLEILMWKNNRKKSWPKISAVNWRNRVCYG